MIIKALNHWNEAQLRAAASRERAKALRDLRLQVTGWLRAALSGGTAHARTRECLDCGA